MAQAAKKASKVTRFYSRGHNQRVTLRSPEVHYDSHGERVETGGEAADFAPNGIWETDDPELIEIIREREGYNVDFFEEGNEPDAIKPIEGDVLNEIVEATAAEDVSALEQILADEKAGHNRPNIVGAADTALTNVRKLVEVGQSGQVEPTEEEIEASEEEAKKLAEEEKKPKKASAEGGSG